MANKETKTTAKAANPAVRSATDASASAKRASTGTNTAEPQGDHVDLMTPAEEDKMREQATKPAAVKKALAEGKKDPIEKFGDPDADQVHTAIRRANFG